MFVEPCFYDIHTHILPGMDDGARDIKTSLDMLSEAKKQGCLGIVATPHYYPRESIESFRVRRREAYQTLIQAIKKKDSFWDGRIVLGAEVAYHQTLVQDNDLHKLCLGQSEYLLLEPPFMPWSSGFIRNIHHMIYGRGFQVIIAHIERYKTYADKKVLHGLFSTGALIQMDAEALLFPGKGRRAISMIRKGMIDVLGSDMHNTGSRPANIGPALARLGKSRAAQDIQMLIDNSERIFSRAAGVVERSK